VNRNREAAVASANPPREMKILYLHEYKGIIYFVSVGVDRGCLGRRKDSGNAPHQVLVMVL